MIDGILRNEAPRGTETNTRTGRKNSRETADLTDHPGSQRVGVSTRLPRSRPTAAGRIDAQVEIIVVLNRCTDDTGKSPLHNGCRIVREDAKNLSRIRNAGVTAASGEIIVTCDADSRMHPDSFREILRRLESGQVVGGGAMVLPERWSLGIVASAFSILPYLAFTGVSLRAVLVLEEGF